MNAETPRLVASATVDVASVRLCGLDLAHVDLFETTSDDEDTRMNVHLKIKIKSLASEAKIIRAEERKWPGGKTAGGIHVRANLHHHRTHTVRREARWSLLAYGFLRDRLYSAIETGARKPVDWDYVQRIAERFSGNPDPRHVRQRFAEWKADALASIA